MNMYLAEVVGAHSRFDFVPYFLGPQLSLLAEENFIVLWVRTKGVLVDFMVFEADHGEIVVVVGLGCPATPLDGADTWEQAVVYVGVAFNSRDQGPDKFIAPT